MCLHDRIRVRLISELNQLNQIILYMNNSQPFPRNSRLIEESYNVQHVIEKLSSFLPTHQNTNGSQILRKALVCSSEMSLNDLSRMYRNVALDVQ